MSNAASPYVPPHATSRPLWLAVLGAPFLFLSHLQLNYMFVAWACTTGHRWVPPVVSALFLVLIAITSLVSARYIRPIPDSSAPPQIAIPQGRLRYLAILGVMTGILFFLAVLAQAVATLILSPCPE